MTSRTLLAVAVMTWVTAARAEAPPALPDAGFEQAEVGKPPAGWGLLRRSRSSGYRVRVGDEKPYKGKHCLQLDLPVPAVGFGHFGRVTRSVPAEAFRGKRVRFTAAARAEVPQTPLGAELYARVHRPGFRPGHC